MKNNEITNAIIQERFGKDSLIALATVDGDIPAVRTVNTVYIDGAFYVVTYALSGKNEADRKISHRRYLRRLVYCPWSGRESWSCTVGRESEYYGKAAYGFLGMVQ